jgi:hypothetical protein
MVMAGRYPARTRAVAVLPKRPPDREWLLCRNGIRAAHNLTSYRRQNVSGKAAT